MKKVIYVIVGQLPPYLYKSFCIKTLIQQGISVEVWDLTTLIKCHPLEQRWHPELIVNIKNRQMLKNKIRKNKMAIYVTGINPEIRFFWLFFYLKRFNCMHLKIANGWLKSYGTSKFVKMVKIRAFFKRKFLELSYYLNIISLPQIAFFPGSYWNDRIPLKKHIVNVNHLLYDEYLELKQKNKSNKKEGQQYILFLDEAMTTHPDNEIANEGFQLANLTTQEYFEKMKYIFSLFEKKFNLPVVIAAHPKAKYQGDEFGSGTFGTRQIVQYKTTELAMSASIFLSHFCTTRAFAFILKKPLYCIYLNAFYSLPQYAINEILFFTKETSAIPVYENENFEIYDKSIDLKKYKYYLYKHYLVKGYENINSLNIIADFLLKEVEKKKKN